jgi:hypothetical protein
MTDVAQVWIASDASSYLNGSDIVSVVLRTLICPLGLIDHRLLMEDTQHGKGDLVTGKENQV